MNEIKALAESLGFKCLENEPMKAHTTFKIGGPAELFIECNDSSKLAQLVSLIKERGVRMTVIGGGSNLLVSDEGIKGAVICICDTSLSQNGSRITAAAGVRLSRLCSAALDSGLSGLEFAKGIPGTVGGAIFMNAGAYGGEIKDVLVSCTSLKTDGTVVTRRCDELGLGYRSSIFKTNGETVLSAEFELDFDEPEAIKARMDEFSRRRREKQPLEYPSAGSTFKRPTGHFAGALIEQCGLKGYAVGGAEVSEKHSGFVINKGNATCEDVKALIAYVGATVLEKTGVELEPEVIILN